MVAAAVVGAGVASAAISSSASKGAANTEANAAQNATAAQTALSEQALGIIRDNNAPYLSAGTNALAQLSALNGIPLTAAQTANQSTFNDQAYLQANPSAQAWVQANPGKTLYDNYLANGAGYDPRFFTTPTTSANGANFDISKLPGYQFQLGQGENAVNNSGAANSGTLNSATLTGLNNYAQGQASTYYGNYLQQLSSIAGLGQASANNSAAQSATTLNNLSTNVGNNITGAGNAQAAGQIGSANAITGGLTNAAGYYSLSKLLGGNPTPIPINPSSPSSASSDPLGDALAGGQFGGG